MNRKFVSKSNRILRKVLNSEENLDILQDFIEAFFNIKIKEITLNPYLQRKSNYLPSEEQEEMNIGIQFIDGYYAQNKMLLYYAQIHSNQLDYEDNRKMVKTTTINILDFCYLKSVEYFNKIVIPSKSESQIELYVLELPKFIFHQSKIIDRREAWMVYLCGRQEKMIQEVVKQFDKIKKLDYLLEKYWQNETMD